jgi:threonine dehydrogenase-like Zn-dependent dehydrogenase
MSEYLLIQNAVAGQSVAVFPDDLPFEVAALNEPDGGRPALREPGRSPDRGQGDRVRRRAHRARDGDLTEAAQGAAGDRGRRPSRAPVDGAARRRGRRHRLLPRGRHRTAGRPARPQHQRARRARPDTDICIDAAGAAAAVNTALRAAKWGVRLVTVAVHQKPEPIDLGSMLRSEMTIIASQGYPTEIFEVTPEIAEHQQRFSRLISHHVPFSEANQAFQLALTHGAAQKVVVTFND